MNTYKIEYYVKQPHPIDINLWRRRQTTYVLSANVIDAVNRFIEFKNNIPIPLEYILSIDCVCENVIFNNQQRSNENGTES